MKNKHGFTIMELAVVFVIISLIVAAIIKGDDLIRAARINTVVTDIQKFKTAIELFKDQYDDLPGDIRNATNYWDVATVCAAVANGDCSTSNNNICNGDGDGQIDVTTASEDLRVWQHLVLANLLDTGNYSGNGAFALETNTPSSKVKGGGYWLHYAVNIIANGNTIVTRSGNLIQFGAWNTGCLIDKPIIKAQEAWSIDQKMDDGVANAGEVVATDGSGGTGCSVNPTVDDSYDVDNVKKGCQMYFWLKP